MRLFLHIGITKTGTSAIQMFLYKNKDILSKKYSIIYPKTGLWFGAGPAHYKLTWFCFSDIEKRFKNFSVLRDFKNEYTSSDQIYSGLIKELQSYDNTTSVVISCENFSTLNPKDVFSSMQILMENIEIEEFIIIAYLRRQDRWMEAAYSQHLKGMKHEDFSRFLMDCYKRKELYYSEFLRGWQTDFPEVTVIPRIYDRKNFIEGNIIFDFLSILEIDIPEARECQIEANTSLSVLSALTLQKINKKFKLSSDEHKRIVKFLIDLDLKEESFIKSFFTLLKRLECLEHFKDSNKKLFLEWFGTENQFVLSEEEIKFYEEQDRIPKEEIDRIVEDRYRRVLTFLLMESEKPKLFFMNYSKPKIQYYPVKEVEFINIDVLQFDLLRYGRLIVGGLVLLKEDVGGDYKLFIKDGEREKDLQWGLPSPSLESKFPHNPKAKIARFKETSYSFRDFIEIFLKNEGEAKRIVRIELG